MADDVATVSSSPALGFAAVVISDQSYSGAAPRQPCSWLVHEPDDNAGDEPFAEPTDQICGGKFLPDAHRAVIGARRVRRHEQPDHYAEFQALDRPDASFIPLRVDPGGGTHADEDASEHQREPAHVA